MVRGDELHVRHRPQRREDGHARGRDDGGAGRRRHARRDVGRRALRAATRSRRASRRSASSSATCRRTTSTSRRAAAATDPRDRRDEALLDVVPDNPNKPYDMHDVIRRIVDDGDVLRGAAGVRGEHPLRLRPPRRLQRRHRREPAGGARGRARHQRLDQGGALHPLLRRVQHPDRDARGRARLPARRRAGAQRHHPARREAPLRVLRGDGARSSPSSRARRTAARTTS